MYRPRARGFTMAELLVVIAVLGVLAALLAPFMLTYWKASTLTAGAQELRTVLNQARQLAIRQNTSVCILRTNPSIQLFTNAACTGTAWVGIGTDANGFINLNNNIQISNSTANVVFNYLGGATTAGVYTVVNPIETTRTLTVTVLPSGRLTIP